MSMSSCTNVTVALFTLLIIGCGGGLESEPANNAAIDAPKAECTERDGAWFGRTADGAMITSQTRAACEERLGD